MRSKSFGATLRSTVTLSFISGAQAKSIQVRTRGRGLMPKMYVRKEKEKNESVF